MEDSKVRKLRFWIAVDKMGGTVTAQNKKLLRDSIKSFAENFKGTKIRQFEVQYKDNADLAQKMLGASVDSLLVSDYASVVSEYDA